MPETVGLEARNALPLWQMRVRIALGAALAALTFTFASYLVAAFQVIQFPFGIDYGEGIVWQQMHMIMGGTAYGPIAGFPAIAFPYPPLFYVISSLFAGLTGMDELAAGRALCVGCAIGTAAIVAGIALQFARTDAERTTYRICGALAALIAMATQPVLDWSLLMRVDMLYVALSFAGLYLGMRALTRPALIHVAAVCFVAAIYTKQIAIGAPIAVFGTLLVLHPRTAWAGIGTGLTLGLIVLAAMMWQTNGGFLVHVGFYAMTKFKLSLIIDILSVFGFHIVFCVVAIWGMRTRWRRLRATATTQGVSLKEHLRRDHVDAAFVMALIYFLTASVLLVAALKRGSSINYFLEWIYLIGLFAGVSLFDIIAELRGAAPPSQIKTWRAPLVLAFIAAQALGLSWVIGEDFYPKTNDRAELGRLVRLIQAAPQPVISDDMVAVLRAGKAVQWEPFIFAELAEKGAWDQTPLIQRINAHRFAFFVTEGYSGDDENYDERYDPAVAAAIRKEYPLGRQLAGYNLHFPGPSLPAYAQDLHEPATGR